MDWDGRFQEAVFDASRWYTVLQELADATGSTRAELVGFGGEGFASFNWVTSVDESTVRDFVGAGGASPNHNFRLAADDELGLLRTVYEADYDRARERIGDTDYVDFCEQYHMVYGCQTALMRGPGSVIGFSLLRSRSDGRTTAENRDIFAQAARAAQTAVRMQRLLDDQGAKLLADGLEAITLPCLVLDGLGQVRAVTATAEGVLERHPLLSLDRGTVTSRNPDLQRRVDLALRAVLGPTPAGQPRVILGGPVPDLVLEFFRLPEQEWSFAFAPRALIVLREPRSSSPAASAAVRAAFGLTEAEARIALALCAGHSRERIARERGVSPETLRTQIRSLYLKTGCRRESELVVLLQALIN